MIIITVKYSVQPGQRDKAMELAREYMAYTWTEKGCIFYEHLPSTVNDQDVYVLEKWETKEDFHAHISTPKYAAFKESRAALLIKDAFSLQVYEAKEVPVW